MNYFDLQTQEQLLKSMEIKMTRKQLKAKFSEQYTREAGLTGQIVSKPSREFTGQFKASRALFSAPLLPIQLRLRSRGKDSGATTNQDTIELSAPLLIRRRGGAVRLVLENGEPTEPKPFPSLIRAIALSRHWADEIVSGKFSNLEGIARSAGLNRRYAMRITAVCRAVSLTDRDDPRRQTAG